MIDLIGLLDGIIGYDYWMVVFFPNSDAPVVHSSQGRFFSFLRHFLQNCHIWSKRVISGPDFLKNDDTYSDFVRFDDIGGLLDN